MLLPRRLLNRSIGCRNAHSLLTFTFHEVSAERSLLRIVHTVAIERTGGQNVLPMPSVIELSMLSNHLYLRRAEFRSTKRIFASAIEKQTAHRERQRIKVESGFRTGPTWTLALTTLPHDI
jgi:hypothetical protein